MLHHRGLLMLSLVSAAQAAGPYRFVIQAGRAAEGELVRVALPLPAGEVTGDPAGSVVVGDERLPAQAEAITRHPDGSVRRVMLSFGLPRHTGGRTQAAWEPAGTATARSVAEVAGTSVTLATDAWRLRGDGAALAMESPEGAALGRLAPFGPQPTNATPATLAVLSNGPWFAWLRWTVDGADYRREVDLQADRRGALRLTQRILRHLTGNDWCPDFGFDLVVDQATPVRLPAQPVRFGALPRGAPVSSQPALLAAVTLPGGRPLSLANPHALKQHRGSLSATVEGARTTIRCSRLEPVARETDNLLLQEGMWRSVEVVVEPAPPEALAAAIDAPLVATADWTLYDAVYQTGEPLEVTAPALRSMVETYRSTIARLPLLGDDWGSLGGLERYNHCGYIWEDYFRTADPRLRQVALDYSENYHDYSVNWGPNPDHYGGGRYPANARTQPWPGSFRTRQNDAVTFCTKGYHGFWLAYEETGDPRFRHAAEQQARWSAQHVHATVNYTRCIGQVTDFVKLYEYTGERSYLAQAERLWTEFQACQNPDLLFNERGVPSTGNDLYIADDSFGAQSPYVKSYIVQYATNALPDLLAHRPDDQRLRDTIIALNDWMARVQTAAGGWSYPGPTTAGFYWSTEYAHGLMKGFQIEPKPAYLTAIGRELRALATLLERHGALTSGVVPWEILAGLSSADLARRYRLGSDRHRTRDFTDGRLTFGYSPDSTVYLQVLLRDYLQQRPEATLFEGDAVLDQIHALPTTVAKPERQEGDPSLRITVGMTAQPKGLLVMLDAGCLYRLSGAQPSWRWHLPDGTTQEGPKAGWVARRAGDYVIKLSARVGDREYTRSVSFTAPPGPGDLGRETWPAGQRVQAESLVAQGGGDVAVQVRTASEKRGAEGGSLSHWNATGAWVEWEVELPRAGRYFMLARYACPIDASRRVSVDGRAAGTLALPATGGYGSASQDDWRMALLAEAGRPLAVDLPAGRCRLRLTNADGQGCNLDYLELVPAEPKQE